MKKWKNTCLLFLAATVTCCSTVYAASDYIIADSNSRYLTYEDVGSLSLQQVNYAKNEIFARKKDRMIRSFQIYKKICSEGNHDILK